MNLTKPSELKVLLQRHGLEPTKRLGQHFLVSESVVQNIDAELQSFAGILEVGPGPGVLTQRLSESHEVLAIEIDPRAVSVLSESAPRARVLQGDALNLNIAELAASLPQPAALASNMPYNLTGPLLTAFTHARRSLGKMVLMMQKEVGKKIVAKPGDSEHGSISVFLQSRFQIQTVCMAPSGAFWPPPKVDSIVLSFVPSESESLAARDAVHEKTVRQGFTQPRKTVENNLASHGVERAKVREWLASEGLPEGCRPHQVPVDAWLRLVLMLDHAAQSTN